MPKKFVLPLTLMGAYSVDEYSVVMRAEVSSSYSLLTLTCLLISYRSNSKESTQTLSMRYFNGCDN